MSNAQIETPTLWDRATRGALTVAALAWGGCSLWINPPRAPKDLRLKEVQRQEDSIRIICEYPDVSDHEVTMREARVTISRKNGLIDWQYTDRWLFDLEHKGSGEIGIALMSLPITLPLSPVLLAASYWFARREEREGISRHGLALLDRIGSVLDRETYDSLVMALQVEWERHKRLRAKVNMDQAQEILSSCHLVWYEEDAFIQAHWYEQTGSGVASYDTRMENAVLVLGSRFTGLERQELVNHYKTIKRIDRRGKSDEDYDEDDA